MRLNPEFRRNLWVEFSPFRIIMAPIAAALFFWVFTAGNFHGNNPGELFNAGKWLFLLVAGVWGAKLAGNSVADEKRAGTWDFQRASGLGPWQMAWGKIFGSSSYAWYAGIILFLASFAAMLYFIPIGKAVNAGTGPFLASLVILAVFAQSVSFLSGFAEWRLHSGIAGVAALLLGHQLLFQESGSGYITWYGSEYIREIFWLQALAALALWAVFGCYRAVRKEFQYSTTPIAWVAFTCFLTVFLVGFGEWERASSAFAVPEFRWLAILGALFYPLLAVEGANRVVFRKIRLHIKARNLEKTLKNMNCWMATMAVGACVALVITAENAEAFLNGDSGAAGNIWLAASLFFFALRDLALKLLLGDGKAGNFAWVAALMALYALLPFVAGIMPYEGAREFFLPVTGKWLSAASAFGQFVFLFMLLKLKNG